MDTSSIELPGSQIDSIVQEHGSLRIRFSRAYIVKSMTGSAELTRWWQSADLILEGAVAAAELPRGPLVCAGGDLDENLYTYRDMLPLPLESRGRIRCELSFRDTDARLVAKAERVRLALDAAPRYIEHVRPQKKEIAD